MGLGHHPGSYPFKPIAQPLYLLALGIYSFAYNHEFFSIRLDWKTAQKGLNGFFAEAKGMVGHSRVLGSLESAI